MKFKINFISTQTAKSPYQQSCAPFVDSTSLVKPSQPKLLKGMIYRDQHSWTKSLMMSQTLTCWCLLMKPYATEEPQVETKAGPWGECAAFNAGFLFEDNNIPFFQSLHLMVSLHRILFLGLSHLSALSGFFENSLFLLPIHTLALKVFLFWTIATSIMLKRCGHL